MGNNLKTLRETLGWTHDDAADALGISRGGYIKLERGERRLNERTLALAAKAFKVSKSVILGDETVAPQQPSPPLEFMGDRDLRVFAAAEGGPGEMVVSTDPIEIVPRPWYLKNVKEGFAVLVTGDSMVPVFEPGDLAIVNPRLAPARGKDVILVADETEGEFRASIKRLLRWTERDWYLRQFNPPPGQKAEFTLLRKEWPKAMLVVGKYYGG
jgi:phage repressor protein C with HTH and peptisase S24 domain